MSARAVILVVDDDAGQRRLVEFWLQEEGYATVTANDGVAGFQAFEQHAPSLVIADIRMPGMSGLDLLNRIKAVSAEAPVILITAFGTVTDAVEAMKLGAVEFLEKPFEDDRLIGVIEAAIRQGEPTAKNEAVTRDIASRVASLSPRERQVMDGLIAGLSNKLIARDYDISPRTIEVYRANVMTKMQANSLSELVRLAMRAGLLKD